MENQKIFDRTVGHLLLTRSHQAELHAAIDRAVASRRWSLSHLLRRAPSNEAVRQEIETSVRELYTIVQSSVTDFVSAELDFQKRNLESSVGDFFQVQTPSRREVEKAVLGTRVRFAKGEGVAPTLQESFTNMTSRQLAEADRIIARDLLGPGGTPNKAMASLTRKFNLSAAQAKTMVNTTMTKASDVTRDLMGEHNKEVISGYVFTAILDSRTTPTCWQNDNLFQSADNVTIRPPLHWGCRSVLVPVLKSRRVMLEQPESPRLNREQLEQITEKRMNGSMPLNETFEQWLRRQPMERQVEILGSEEHVSLFQRGALRLSEFIKAGTKRLSVPELRLREARSLFGLARDRQRHPRPRLEAVNRPAQLVRSRDATRELMSMLQTDAVDSNHPLSLVDYRGVTLGGKRSSRRRTYNELDPRNTSFDPWTGEVRSTLYYDPDYEVLQERLDFLRNSKTLSQAQKTWIVDLVEGLEDSVSTNQKTAITEALRVLFERQVKAGADPWESFPAALRSEMNFAVVNASRILDRRSRARSELFHRFAAPGEEPAINILGEYVTFRELDRGKLATTHFIADWDKQEGRALARRLFFTLKSPTRAYLLGYRPKIKGPDKKLVTWLEKNVPGLAQVKFGELKASNALAGVINEKVPTIKKAMAWYDWWHTPRDPILIRARRAMGEKVQSILDLEFLYLKDRRTILDRAVLSPALRNEEHIRALQNSMRLIATGVMTDYDGLAIALGKELHKHYRTLLPWHKPTLREYHRDGSRLLESLRRQGVIRVQSRGVVRRSTIDLETGRAVGNWKNTVSREVIILDPDLLELQKASRRVEIANRIGVTDETNRLYVKAGNKTYFDSRGKDTRNSIITRSASTFYDNKHITKDISEMMNHTMGVQYRTDPEFASFFLDLARYRDNRGRAEYFDALNSFRHEIIRRGEQGYGFLETLKYHTQRGQPFSNIARIDGRGRLYYNGYLTPTGGEVIRPFLNSAQAKSMTPNGIFQIQTSLGTLLGEGMEVLTNQGRLDAFYRNEAGLLKLGELISAKTQRERRLREFLEHPLVREAEGEEVAKLARFALEYYRIHRHMGGDMDFLRLKNIPEAKLKKLATYQTQLAGEIDASASGLQMIALATGDRRSAAVSNILPTARKERIYDLVNE